MALQRAAHEANSAHDTVSLCLQNWIPTFLGSLGINDPVLVGCLAALPWVASSLLSFFFGFLFSELEKRGLRRYRARTVAHMCASLGAALAFLPLALQPDLPAVPALACMGIAISMQTCNYPGFHSYVQTYGAERAGTILGVTNSCGIVVGIIGNLVTGSLVAATGSYTLVFQLTAAIYASSAVVWLLLLKGQPVYAELGSAVEVQTGG